MEIRNNNIDDNKSNNIKKIVGGAVASLDPNHSFGQGSAPAVKVFASLPCPAAMPKP